MRPNNSRNGAIRYARLERNEQSESLAVRLCEAQNENINGKHGIIKIAENNKNQR